MVFGRHRFLAQVWLETLRLFRRRLSAEGAKPESNDRWKMGSGNVCMYVCLYCMVFAYIWWFKVPTESKVVSYYSHVNSILLRHVFSAVFTPARAWQVIEVHYGQDNWRHNCTWSWLRSLGNKNEGLRIIRVASLVDHQPTKRDASFNLHGHSVEYAKREKVVRMPMGNYVQHVWMAAGV